MDGAVSPPDEPADAAEAASSPEDRAASEIGPHEDVRYYFDESIAGKPCTCEGGAAVEGTQVGGRATYTGVATGRRFDQGDPPWRWIEMIGRSDDDPAASENSLVWCEESFAFFEGER
jgi:hypothetical protein